jgi:hypothetical protein
MEHEANGLVLIFLGEASACRQDGTSACSQRRPLTDCLQDRERSRSTVPLHHGLARRCTASLTADVVSCWWQTPRAVEFLSTQAIVVLDNARQHAQAYHIGFCLVAGRAVRRLFAQLRVIETFEFCDNSDE